MGGGLHLSWESRYPHLHDADAEVSYDLGSPADVAALRARSTIRPETLDRLQRVAAWWDEAHEVRWLRAPQELLDWHAEAAGVEADLRRDLGALGPAWFDLGDAERAWLRVGTPLWAVRLRPNGVTLAGAEPGDEATRGAFGERVSPDVLGLPEDAWRAFVATCEPYAAAYAAWSATCARLAPFRERRRDRFFPKLAPEELRLEAELAARLDEEGAALEPWARAHEARRAEIRLHLPANVAFEELGSWSLGASPRRLRPGDGRHV